MPCVMKAAFCKIGIATGVSLIPDGDKSGYSGVFHQQDGVASLVLSSLPDDMVLEEVTFLQHPTDYL